MNVLIVGGGIAGLNCALRLLGAGHRVTVAEKQRGSIDKVCGEGILPFGVELLKELGLLEQVREAGIPFYGVSYHLGEQQVMARFENGRFGVGIERGLLDRILRVACGQWDRFELKEGVTVRPETARGFERVLVADGIHTQWGTSRGRETVYGKRLGIRFRVEVENEPMVAVHFFKEGEVYLTPSGESTLSAAFLIDPERVGLPGGKLKDWCRRFFQRHFPHMAGAPIRDMAARGPIVSKPKGSPPPYHLLGDAYRAFDPICGAGMGFGLLCGKLASEYLDEPAAYYRALSPAEKAVNDFTNTILFFRGGGLKTSLMIRQLAKAPHTFERILAFHDGGHRFWDLGVRGLLSLLKPF